MKRRRNLHFGSVGFAGLGRSIIKNNNTQTNKHRKRATIKISDKTEYRESKNVTKEDLLTIQEKLKNEQKRDNWKTILFSIVILCLLIAFYTIAFH